MNMQPGGAGAVCVCVTVCFRYIFIVLYIMKLYRQQSLLKSSP